MMDGCISGRWYKAGRTGTNADGWVDGWTHGQITKHQNRKEWSSPGTCFYCLEVCMCVHTCVCVLCCFQSHLHQPSSPSLGPVKPESEPTCATLRKLLTHSGLSETTLQIFLKKVKTVKKNSSKMHKSICVTISSLFNSFLYIFFIFSWKIN